MEARDIQIIAQNSSTAAAMLLQNAITPNHDTDDIMAEYASLHSKILNHVLAEIASHVVQQTFPGSVQALPPQGPQGPPAGGIDNAYKPRPSFPQPQDPAASWLQQAYPQPNPDPFPVHGAAPAPPQPFVPQVVPDHQIMANAQPPAAVAPQGGGHKDDHLWQNWFAQPGDWYDNQFDKKNPNGPDFKSKSIPDPKNAQYKAGLWIKDAPPWAKAQLQAAGRIA